MHSNHKIVIFTDLDATLLDPHSYSWAPATEALDELKALGASLVLVSSKTFAEMRSLPTDLGFHDPMIIENGGGIIWSRLSPIDLSFLRSSTPAKDLDQGEFLLVPLGTGHDVLLNSLKEISNETGIEIRCFSDMTVQEISALTGLDEEASVRSQIRLFDEPFLVIRDSAEDVQEIQSAAEARGLVAVQGGRFWHLMGHGGKGKAVTLLMEAYKNAFGRIFSVGLGDSPNDFPFLELVDQPVIVGGQGQGIPVPKALSGALKTSEVGPAGWNRAIYRLLTLRQEVQT
jgi:mannosyl-3-phosphoglycerate phosphatase